jgi:hypothetical protein
MSPHKEVAEHRAVRERCDPERGECDHVPVEHGGLGLGAALGREDVVAGDQEDKPEGALDVAEDLVPEPHEER